MTSNIGAELIKKGTVLGFASRSDEAKTREQSYDRMKENLLNELKKAFRPEFLNRVDGTVVFHSLTKEQIREIVDLMLSTVNKQLSEKEIKLEVTDVAKDFLGEKGYDEVYGARPLRRVIQNMVEDKLSEAVLREEFKVFDRIFEAEASINNTGIIDNVLKDIKDIPNASPEQPEEEAITPPEIFQAERKGNTLKVFSNKSIKFRIENIIKERLKEVNKDKEFRKYKDSNDFRVAEDSYISYVVVDLKDDEIVIESKDNFSLPNIAVGAAK